VSTDLSARVEDVKTKSNELKKNVSEAAQQVSQKMNESMSNFQQQLMNYGNQIQQLLNTVSANIEDYRFLVEKTEDGLKIDVSFKASVKSKGGTTGSVSEISP
jgi:FtsZ-binding cell division protein ZapB